MHIAFPQSQIPRAHSESSGDLRIGQPPLKPDLQA